MHITGTYNAVAAFERRLSLHVYCTDLTLQRTRMELYYT